MNLRFMLAMICLASAMATTSTYAEDGEKRSDSDGSEAKKSTEDWVPQVAKKGPGVWRIHKDDKGRITALVVVGQARISMALGASAGKETARKKAMISASAEFIKWLKNDISIHESSDNETVTLMEGEEASHKEFGKRLDKDSTSMKSVSEGLVRGLQMISRDVDPEAQAYTVILGWKADTAEATKRIASDLAGDKTGSFENGNGAPEKPGSKAKGKDSEIKGAKAKTDSDADGF